MASPCPINKPSCSKAIIYRPSIESDVHCFAEAVRNQWSIKDQLHGVLDVNLKKDSRHECQEYSAENLAVIRHIGVNLLCQEKKGKVGIEDKRLKAGWDNHYLETVLSCLSIPTS